MTFNKFDDVYLLTGGGAGTEVVGVRVYEFLTDAYDIGAAAAQAVVLAAVLMVFVAVYLALLRRPEGRLMIATRWRPAPCATGVSAGVSPCFVLVTVFPFYYMLVLSLRPIERLLLDPGALSCRCGSSPSTPTPRCCARARRRTGLSGLHRQQRDRRGLGTPRWPWWSRSPAPTR